MKRREFLRGTAAGVLGSAALTLAACTSATTEQGGLEDATDSSADAPSQGSALPAVEWRIGTSWPISLDTIYGGAQTVAERVAAMTNGMFKLTPLPAGELFPGLEVLQNIQQGTVEAGHTAAYYYVGLNSALAFATSAPFGLTAQQQNAWLYHGGGLDAMRQVFAQFNVINFPAGNTGTQMGGWFRNEINTLADLQGLRMRIPGLGGEVMVRLGVATQTIPGGEIYQALQTGAIDATEWVGPYDDQKLGFNEVADFYYTPGWWEPGPALDLQVSLDAYNKLPKEYQEILAAAAYTANIDMLAKYDALNRIALDELLTGGVQLRTYSDEIMVAAQQASFELFEENAANNPDFKAVYEPWKEFRSKIYTWSQTNEQPFNIFVANNPI
ncbi:MAG: TRAP transporter substrate-binding protein [Chloroflexales bacterium]|nr:TRAP transporter substrate-binding protein [Chloroflexales bacterium]